MTESSAELRQEINSILSELEVVRHTHKATEDGHAERIQKLTESKRELQNEVKGLRLRLADLSRIVNTVHADEHKSIRSELESVLHTQRLQAGAIQDLPASKFLKFWDVVQSLQVALHDLQCSHEEAKAKSSKDASKLSRTNVKLQDELQSVRRKVNSVCHASKDIESLAVQVANLRIDCESNRQKVEQFTEQFRKSNALLSKGITGSTGSNAKFQRKLDKTAVMVSELQLDVKVQQLTRQEQPQDAQLIADANRNGRESSQASKGRGPRKD